MLPPGHISTLPNRFSEGMERFPNWNDGEIYWAEAHLSDCTSSTHHQSFSALPPGLFSNLASFPPPRPTKWKQESTYSMKMY